MKTPAFIGALLCAAVLGQLTATKAQAEIVRHCTAWIGPRILSGVDKNGNKFTVRVTRSRGIVKLSGRGTCRGKAWANDCRRRARDAIIHCARGLWAARWRKRVPPEVCESASNTRPPHAGIVKWTASRNDIKRALEYTACCKLIPDARFLNFAVYLRVSGDSRCHHTSSLEPLYKADCKRMRKQGLCAKRTSG